MRSSSTLDARLYDAALRLYPPSFHREFADEMRCDFTEARAEALAAPASHHLWTFWARMTSDCARGLLVQWTRTGWPAIAVLSMLCTVVIVGLVTQLWPRTPLSLPTGTANAEIIAVEFIAVTTLLFLMATIVLTLWSARFVRRRRG